MGKNLTRAKSEQSPTTIRVLGGLLIFIGTILVGGMAAIMMWMNNAINNPASTNKFNGTPEQQKIIFLVLGTVAVFGFSATIAGIYQMVTGQRNKKLIWLMLGLWIVLMILVVV